MEGCKEAGTTGSGSKSRVQDGGVSCLIIIEDSINLES